MWLDLPFHMNGIILLMLGTKSKDVREGHVVHTIVLPLGGPMESGVPCIIAEKKIELTNDLSVLVVLEAHEILKIELLKLGND
jgi:hypothetical protein